MCLQLPCTLATRYSLPPTAPNTAPKHLDRGLVQSRLLSMVASHAIRGMLVVARSAAMYLRHTTVKKNGKVHTYWRLVRSVRSGSTVKQVTVCQLGELDEAGRLSARQLADTLIGVERQPGLFDDP